MKKKNNEGFSLVEVLVAIVILAAIVIPACTSLVLSHRINAKTDSMLRSQLAVSSAAEALMAEGISEEYKYEDANQNENYGYVRADVPADEGTNDAYIDRFPSVLININRVTEYGAEKPYYTVKITSIEDLDVAVTTTIRCVQPVGVQLPAEDAGDGE